MTRKGYIPGNPNKQNQDNLIIKQFNEFTHLFSVCDGHGANGHDVSQFIVDHFPDTL
jgi:serine/threonine protein phosphatase PrpC